MDGQEGAIRPEPDYNRPEPGIFNRPVEIKEMTPEKKKQAIKLLMFALGALILVLVGLLLVSYVRFGALKTECQSKLDYWVDKCADRVPANMPNISIDFIPVPPPTNESPDNTTIMIGIS